MIKINGTNVIAERDKDGRPVILFSNAADQPMIDRIIDISSPTSTANTRVEFWQATNPDGVESDIPAEQFRENADDIYAALSAVGAKPPAVIVPFDKKLTRWIEAARSLRTPS